MFIMPKRAPSPASFSPFLVKVVVLLLLACVMEAQLLLTAITPSNATILATANYTFYFSRFATAPLPLNSLLLLTFNSQYASQGSSTPHCSSTGIAAATPSCSFSGSVLFVRELFASPGALSPSSFSLTVSNIVNPIPAGDYSPLTGITILAPNASVVQSGSSGAAVTIVSGAATCYTSISNPYAFTNGQISVTYSSPYITTTTNYRIFASVPTTYPDDPTATSIDPASSLTQQPNIYPGTFLFQAPFTSTFTINLKMPPSTKPAVNFINVYTQTTEGVVGNVDSCSITISGIQPTTFSTMSISRGTVQTVATLLFDLTLSTPLFQTDTLTILFPSAFSLAVVPTVVTVAGFGTLTLTRLDSTLQISAISSQAVLNPRLLFNISSVGMPFTAAAYNLSLTLGTVGNYSRIMQTYPYSAAPGVLNVVLYCLNTQIGTNNTQCQFSMSTVSQINSDGTLNVMFPNQFPLAQSNFPCPLSGVGLYSSADCHSFISSNSIRASSLTPTTTNILPLPLTLTFNNINMSRFVGNYSLTVYTMSRGAIVDQGSVYLATIARVLRPNEFYVSSSTSITNSVTTYTAYFSLPFDLGVTYTVVLTLPFTLQNGLALAITGGTLLSFSASVLTFTASQLTNNYSVSITNMLSPASLQPATVTLQVIYSDTVQFTGSASVAMSQIKPFGTVTVIQSNQVVYAPAIATFTLSDLQVDDKIVLTAYTGFYENVQTNCTSGIVSCGASGVLTVLNASSALTTFQVNIRNLGYFGQSRLNITSYDSTRTFAKQSSVVDLNTDKLNAIIITANQTNPYLSESSIYTFALTFTTPNPTSLVVTPPVGLLVTAANCLFNCGNATKSTIGYIFSVSSTNCRLTVTLTNPLAFGPSVKFTFTTTGTQGNMDYGEYFPQAECATPCRSCSASSSSSCLTCYSWSAQTILSNSTCIGACPTGFFQTVSSSVDVCSPCSSLCNVCSGSSTNCTDCKNGTFLFNLGCYQSCPLGSYLSSTICIACLQANCAVCNQTTCTVCMTGFSFFNFTCLTVCPGNYYSNSGRCVPCAFNCLVCSPTDGTCTNCLTPNLLYGGTCYPSCPNGVFQQVSNNVCQSCQPPCASCSLLSTNCTSCLSLFNSTRYYYLASHCYPTTCPNGYFPDPASPNCVTCSWGCSTCSASGCSTCNVGLFIYQGKCFAECPNATYGNSTLCIGCSSICSNCLSATTCTSCITGYNLFDSACLLTCPLSYYANLTGNVCLMCKTPCNQCNYLGCINCLPSFYLQQTTCTPSCSGQFRPNNATMVCEACRPPCLGCTWSTSCTSCLPSYSLLGQECLSACPVGYYSNGGQCISCPGNCTTCSFLNNQPACTNCLTGMLLFSFNCLAVCPNGTLSANGYCLSDDCSSLPNCISCAGSQCLHCSALYQMDSAYSCSETVNGSAVAGALMSIPVPFPFLIAILMLMVVAFLLKHNFPKMFSPLFLYAIAGCFEFLSLALWTLLSVFWNLGNSSPLPYGSVVYAPVLIGCVYVCLNVVQFVLWSRKVQGDRQYRLWEKQDNRCASLSIAIVSLFLSFRLDALKFSKTAHDPHLSARLSAPQVFRHYWVLALFSILLSAVTILASTYISYMQVSLNYLFFTGVEVAVIAIIMIVLSSAVLCVSRSQLLEDRSEYHVGYDQDQLDGKSVEELLNGLAIVQEHHEHNDYSDSGNAVLMKNDYSSEHLSQDLTLMQPVPTLSFHDKPESLLQINNQSGQQTEPLGVEEEGERDEIFGVTAEVSSQDHILVDEFERDRREAAQLATHYGLAEQPLNTTYPRQTGAIVKQRLPQLHEDSQIQSVGSFQQFAVDMKRGRWQKQTPGRQPLEEEEQPQGEDIEELQIKEIIERRLKEEEMLRRKELEEARKEAEEEKKREQLRKRVEQLKLQEIAREKERRRQQELFLQKQIEGERRRQQEQRVREQEQRVKQQQKKRAMDQQLRREQQQMRRHEQQKRLGQEQLRRREQAQLQQKKRVGEQRIRKIELQKRRQQQWRRKKQQAILLKLQEERQLQEKMQQLRRQEEELQRTLQQQEAIEMASLQQQRLQQLQQSRQELEKINRLKANLQQLEGMAQQYQSQQTQLQQEERQLHQRQQEKARENKERGLMAVEDRLSRMAIVFEDMWRKAAQITNKPSRKVRNEEERQVKVPAKAIQYHNVDQNIVTELSPRKIKVSARPHPNQYTRRHLFVEEGKQILSDDSSSGMEEEELEIVFDGERGESRMSEQAAVEKPKSILHHHRPDKAKLDYLHYHDKDIKEVEDLHLKSAFAHSSSIQALRAAPHKQMPKEDTDEPITMVFQDNMAEVLELEAEDEDNQSSKWSHPSKLSARPNQQPPVDIEYVARSIHSQSSDTHWPIEPEMQQRILEIERRADRYISEPKRKENVQPYLHTPQDRIYEEEGEEGETELGEIVFEESDQILEEESRATGFSRSASSGRRRYPTGRVNRMVIDLSPPR